MSKGPFTSSVSDNSAVVLAILFSLKTMELLDNGLHPHSGVTPLFSSENSISSVITDLSQR